MMVDQHTVSMPRESFAELLASAAEEGANRALRKIGLSDEHAAADIEAIRSVVGMARAARSTAWQTFVRLATTAVFAAILAAVGIKLKLLGE